MTSAADVCDHFNFQLLQFLCVILGIWVDSALLCGCFGSAVPVFVISLLFLVVFSPNLEIHLFTTYIYRKEYFYVIIQYIDDYLNSFLLDSYVTEIVLRYIMSESLLSNMYVVFEFLGQTWG